MGHPRSDNPPPPDGPLPGMLIALTVATGAMDAFSFLALGHIFVANMTGNVVILATSLLGFSFANPLAAAIALAGFVAGGLVAGWVASRMRERAKLVGWSLGGQVVIVALASLFWDGEAQLVAVAMLAASMGAQNAVVRNLGVSDLTTTVLTLAIAGAASDVGGSVTRRQAMARRIASVAALFVGAAAGAGLTLAHPGLPLLLVMAISLVVAIVSVVAGRRSAPWSVR